MVSESIQKQAHTDDLTRASDWYDTNRRVLHVDMDAFYVEVELLKRPELRGLPVVVGGKSPRGVVSTCSYEARAFGLHSAMPSIQAQRLCPHAIWLDSDFASYADYSGRFFGIMQRYSPDVVRLSIDEGRVDLTGSERLFGPAPEIAHRIITEIRTELGLPASGGLANSGTAAKIAAELAKPRGLAIVLPGYEPDFLAPLNVERIPGIGKHSLPRFHQLGIRTIGDLAKRTPVDLIRMFGKWAGHLHTVASGAPGRVQRYQPIAPSRSHETTFAQDIFEPDQLTIELRHLIEKLGFKLRQEGLRARTITIKIRDGAFNTVTRSHTFTEPVDSDRLIFPVACRLLLDNLPSRLGVRLIGVAVHNLSSTQIQLDLFRQNSTKVDTFYRTVDAIKEKFGRKSLGFGHRAIHPGS